MGIKFGGKNVFFLKWIMMILKYKERGFCFMNWESGGKIRERLVFFVLRLGLEEF